ncbi:hypothetical protein WN51_12353 [Melipona quadrifasciata]|uniref:Uncharacterized protein n=1 Tax=Melipona quadrifasciata TaxID=166423 RepID=A0A0M9A4S0_9HYME|nr:hypothetical protein WN51_12353 [Melipona quadrifasciata]
MTTWSMNTYNVLTLHTTYNVFIRSIWKVACETLDPIPMDGACERGDAETEKRRRIHDFLTTPNDENSELEYKADLYEARINIKQISLSLSEYAESKKEKQKIIQHYITGYDLTTLSTDTCVTSTDFGVSELEFRRHGIWRVITVETLENGLWFLVFVQDPQGSYCPLTLVASIRDNLPGISHKIPEIILPHGKKTLGFERMEQFPRKRQLTCKIKAFKTLNPLTVQL